MYYWDGQSWRSTLSPDGRLRWDGASWTPVHATVATPYGMVARPQREHTSWTRPLQISVAGWYVWSILYTLAGPLWMGGMMNGLLSQSVQRQQQINPDFSPPPAALTDMMSSFVTLGIWATVIVYSLVFGLIIVGAWQRWVWMYYVVLVLLGLTSILVPVDLIYVFIGPAMSAAQGGSMPSWLYPVSFLTGLPAIGLFVWMLIALIKRGPWAMHRPQLH